MIILDSFVVNADVFCMGSYGRRDLFGAEFQHIQPTRHNFYADLSINMYNLFVDVYYPLRVARGIK